MPVSLLLVEGELDAAVLAPLLGPQLTVTHGGVKASLKRKTRELRGPSKQVAACYLRDRDFDYDPPADGAALPTVDAQERTPAGGEVTLGFRWARHAIENYLLEPGLVEQATGWAQADYIPALLTAAAGLRFYTAARWAVAIARRQLPRLWDLPTRPTELTNDMKLPSDCSETACFTWARDQVSAFATSVRGILGDSSVEQNLQERSLRLAALGTPAAVLLWHAGKDLLAALAPHLPRPRKDHPRVFLRDLQSWVSQRPEQALNLHPEWRALKAALLAA